MDRGSTLKFSGCDISSCTGYTWRSIYADEGATVIVEDKNGTPTKIWDADTALNLRSGADYDVTNSEFTNNYVGMYLYNYPRSGTGNIYGNTFSTSLSSSLLTSPVGSYSYGLSAISLNHTENIQIGKTGQTGNIFEDLYLGVKSSNSNMEVYNNTFENIHSLWGTTSGYEIYATSDFDYNDRILVIGDDAIGNDFKSSENGVYAYGEQNIYINSNLFGLTGEQLTQNSIYIANNDKDIDVLNNDFYDFNIGTYLYDIKKSDSTVNIGGNTYHNADLTLGGSYYGTAITIQNPTQTENNLNIFDNTIEKPRIGIHLKKVINGKIYKDVAANGNDISYDISAITTLTDDHSGILLDDCDNTYVTENKIWNIDPLTSTPAYLQGINVVASVNGNFCSNTIDKMGYGFYINGSCTDTKLKLNHITGYETAIRFNGTFFTTQGLTTETWENIFDNGLTTKKRLDGSFGTGAGGIFWYYNSANSSMDVSNTYNGIPLKINATGISGYGISDCDAFAMRMANTDAESETALEFNLYPNPASDNFIIEQISSSDNSFEINVIDITGRVLFSKNSNNVTTIIDASNFPTGIYNVMITMSSEIIASKKIVIQH